MTGSGDRIDGAELRNQNQAFDDIHKVLFRLPGINITEEEGYGLRPNIGMRGSGTERSANITLMEDGVLAAPAPYAAPSAYYFPTTGRMEGIEVRKGSSQIKFGPRTNGGALNLLSTSIPDDFSFRARMAGGGDDTRKLYAMYGDGAGQFSWMLESYRIDSDGFKVLPDNRETGFDLEDYVGKIRWSSPRGARLEQRLTAKAGYTDQLSHETYLGLTESDFSADPFRRYAASQVDRIDTDHRQYMIRHFLGLSKNLDFTTTIYRNEFARNWYKLDKVNGTSITDLLDEPDANAAELAILRGGESEEDALAVKANNREYFAQGVDLIAGYGTMAGRSWHDIEIGIRLHEDEEDRFQHTDQFRMESDGTMVLTSPGVPGASGGGDNRVNSANAVAVFAQDHVAIGDKLTISTGLRLESINTKREQYGSGDPGRKAAPVETTASTREWIPGIGASYRWTREFNTFGGIHKGFAPPGPGADDATDSETSLNYEAGARYTYRDLKARAIGFFNDYRNLLGKDTFATGGTGGGDQFNAGEVNVYGLEASLRFDGASQFDIPVSLPVQFAYTWTVAEFQGAFDSRFQPWGTVESGDRMPYLPEHQISLSAGIERPRWRAEFFGSYLGETRSEAGRGKIPDSKRIDSRFIVDLTGEVSLSPASRAFVSITNVTNEIYNVARRPAGLRPGLPRRLLAGIKLEI